MNKSIVLGFSVLELSKQLMYESWYDYVKSKTVLYGCKYFLCIRKNR